MTLNELKNSGHIIFECISGSRAYGLDTPTSDTDIRGVFVLPKEKFYSLDYIGQINNETNDIAYYELRKFIELCAKNNPNILEMLSVPSECVLYEHPIFSTIKKEVFLSKLCKNTFGNYAFTQIKKARGLNKKVVNPMAKERKSILDFCSVYDTHKSVSLHKFLETKNLKQEHCGLSLIPNIKNCFKLFYNENANYKGIAKEGANELNLSKVAKEEIPIAMLYLNLEGYSSYCKRYKEYWNWVAKRNEERYKNNIANEKNYDAKNMMHTFRLLHMAKEIGETGSINVKRPDRALLLDIKNGKFEYDTLVSKAENLRTSLDVIFEESELPEKPDIKIVNELLIKLRNSFYETM